MSNSAFEKKLKGLIEKNYPLAKDISPDDISKALKKLNKLMAKQSYPKKARGGPIKKKKASGGVIRKTKKGKK